MRFKKVSSSTNDVLPRGYRVMGVRLLSGTADAVAIVFDEAGGVTGTDFCTLSVTEDTSNGTGLSHPAPDIQMFGSEGFFLNNGLSLTLSGSGAALYVYYV
jgi:hypothetical protein